MECIKKCLVIALLISSVHSYLYSQVNQDLITDGEASVDIIHLNVGQGDATIFLGPIVNGKRKTLIYDSGEIADRSKDGGMVVLMALVDLQIDEVDYYVSSHHHSDHYGGLLYDTPTTTKYGSSFVLGLNQVPGALGDDDNDGEADWTVDKIVDSDELGLGDDIKVLEFIDRGPKDPGSAPTGYNERYLTIAGQMGNHQEVITLDDVDNTSIDLGGGATLECVASNGFVKGKSNQVRFVNTENEKSLAFVMHYKDFHYFIGGDINGRKYAAENAKIEKEIAKYLESQRLTLDAFQVNHHGANNCSEEDFLEITKPKAAIISCGDDNEHGHPHKETLERLINAGVAIYQTERGKPKDDLTLDTISKQHVADGHIYLQSNGTGFLINY